MSDERAWVRRFTAPEMGFPAWSTADPSLLALISTLGGVAQVWTHESADGSVGATEPGTDRGGPGGLGASRTAVSPGGAM